MRVGGTSASVRKRGLRRANFVESVLIVGASGEAALQQRRLTRKRILLDLQVRGRTGNVGAGPDGLRAKLRRLQLCRCKLSLGLLERHAEGCRIDPEEYVAALHAVAILDVHGDDGPVHLRADR